MPSGHPQWSASMWAVGSEIEPVQPHAHCGALMEHDTELLCHLAQGLGRAAMLTDGSSGRIMLVRETHIPTSPAVAAPCSKTPPQAATVPLWGNVGTPALNNSADGIS